MAEGAAGFALRQLADQNSHHRVVGNGCCLMVIGGPFSACLPGVGLLGGPLGACPSPRGPAGGPCFLGLVLFAGLPPNFYLIFFPHYGGGKASLS